MTLKYIGKKIWDIAIRLSEFSCTCGWEGDELRARGSHANIPTIEQSTKNQAK
jgi:hypothetical protein